MEGEVMPVVKLLDVNGDARQRGEAHGEAMRDEVVAGIERWRDELNAVQPMSPDAFIEYVQTSTQFARTVNQLTPDLMAEVRGIASGANLDFDTVFAFQTARRMLVAGSAVGLKTRTEGKLQQPGMPRRGWSSACRPDHGSTTPL